MFGRKEVAGRRNLRKYDLFERYKPLDLTEWVLHKGNSKNRTRKFPGFYLYAV